MPIVPCHALAVSTAASGRALAPTRGHRHPDAPAPRQTGGVISRTQYLVNALLVPLPFLLAEFEFFNFPSGGLGEIAKLHGLGALKMRHVLTAEGDDVLGSGLHAWLGYHKGFGHLPPALVRDSDHGDFLHGGMPVNGVFHLDGRNVLTAADDDVLFAIA